MKIKILINTAVSFFTIIVAAIFNVSVSYAGTKEMYKQLYSAGDKAWGATATPGPGSLAQIVQVVISAFLSLLGIIFLILIIYAGFNWMTAQGDEEKVTKAKDTLTRAIIGLIIITMAYAITYFVFSSLPGGEGSGADTTGL